MMKTPLSFSQVFNNLYDFSVSIMVAYIMGGFKLIRTVESLGAFLANEA